MVVAPACLHREALREEDRLDLRLCRQWADGEALLRLRELPNHGPDLAQELNSGRDLIWRSLHRRVVGVPGLQYLRVGLPQDLYQWEEHDPIQHYREGVTLGDSLLAEDDYGLAA